MFFYFSFCIIICCFSVFYSLFVLRCHKSHTIQCACKEKYKPYCNTNQNIYDLTIEPPKRMWQNSLLARTKKKIRKIITNYDAMADDDDLFHVF